MNFTTHYFIESFFGNVKLIKEEENFLYQWANKIADILGLRFDDFWDRTGIENIMPNEIIQFTDVDVTGTTFTYHYDYSKNTSFDELLDGVREKLKFKRTQFGEGLVIESEDVYMKSVIFGIDKHDVPTQVIDGDLYLTLYHGTSKKNYNRILKTGVLKTNSYFAVDEHTAKRYSQMTGGIPVVDTVVVNANGLVFDGNYFYANRDLHFLGGVWNTHTQRRLGSQLLKRT